MTHFGSKTFVEYRLVDLKVIQWKRKKREKADGFGNRRYAEEPYNSGRFIRFVTTRLTDQEKIAEIFIQYIRRIIIYTFGLSPPKYKDQFVRRLEAKLWFSTL